MRDNHSAKPHTSQSETPKSTTSHRHTWTIEHRQEQNMHTQTHPYFMNLVLYMHIMYVLTSGDSRNGALSTTCSDMLLNNEVCMYVCCQFHYYKHLVQHNLTLSEHRRGSVLLAANVRTYPLKQSTNAHNLLGFVAKE